MKAKTDFYFWLVRTGGTVQEIVKYLKDLGVDYMEKAEGWNLLHLAVQDGGNIEVVQYLKDLGVDYMEKAEGRNLLHLAVQDGGNIEVIQYIKELFKNNS